MFTKIREQFNAVFDISQSKNIWDDIDKEFPGYRDFKIAEIPVFLDNELKSKLLMAGNTCLDVILAPDFIQKNMGSEFQFGQKNSKPDFICLDFAITLNEHDEFIPKLIEAQGFPTLLGFQQYLTGKFKKHCQIPSGFTSHFNRINAFHFSEKIGSILKQYGDDTVLLEAYPEKQRTRLDFKLTEAYWGIKTVCLSQIEANSGKLYYKTGDNLKPINAIYNRVIIEEVVKTYPELLTKIELLKEVEVSWISHPDWYYLISKAALPLFKGPYVPSSKIFYKGDDIPENLEDYILKPLFEYGGDGVQLDLNQSIFESCLENVPYLLQQKVRYADCILLPNGQKRKAEIRLIYGQEPSKKRPTLLANLTRLSDSGWMNTSQNFTDFTGGSIAFFENI